MNTGASPALFRGLPMTMKFDNRDCNILEVARIVREGFDGPRCGDFILFPTGELERFSYDWGEEMQTSADGSFYLGLSGRASFSGALNPATPKAQMKRLAVSLPGAFWFFHHDEPGAGRGVACTLECRVFRTSARYEGSPAAEAERAAKLRAELARRLNAVPVSDRPLAAEGYLSYRCKGAFDWIMIGAKDDADAMVQARRSSAYAKRETLQKWNGAAYVPC